MHEKKRSLNHLVGWLVRSFVCMDEPNVSFFLRFTFYACSHLVLDELQGFLSVSSATRQPITKFSSTFFAILLFLYISSLLVPKSHLLFLCMCTVFLPIFGYPHKSLVCRQRQRLLFVRGLLLFFSTGNFAQFFMVNIYII